MTLRDRHCNQHRFFVRGALRRVLASTAVLVLLSGCYAPINGVRESNPGPTATPPWPYEQGVYPPGGGIPTGGAMRPATGYAPWPAGGVGQTPPPPSQSEPAQYADWLFDGPEGRGFAWYLAQGYRRYAKHEDNAHDFEDAAKFLARAGAVERGEHVEPEHLTMRTLPAYAVDDLLYARQRLMRALANGAAVRLPKIAANAQVAFDCWMEQQEENFQPHDVARCRRDFEAFIVRLEGLREVGPACAPAEPACVPQSHLVFFDLGRHELTAAGRDTLQQVVEQARRSPAGSLIVSAHTDRSGSDQLNDALSRRRLDTVLDALSAAGIARERLARAEYYGERQPRVPTADGTRMPENRRVEIRLSCTVPSAPAAVMCGGPSAQPACDRDAGCRGQPTRGK